MFMFKFKFLIELKIIKIINKYIKFCDCINLIFLYLNYNTLNFFFNNFFFNNFFFNNFFFNNFFFNNFFFNNFFFNNLNNYNFSYFLFYYYINFSLSFNLKIFLNIYKINLFFIKYFIIKYIYFFLYNKKIIFNLNKNNFKFIDLSIYYFLIFSKFKKFFFLKEINIHIKSFIFFLFFFLFSKDIILFKNYIKYCLEIINLKKHKRFFYNLKIFFNLIFNILSFQLSILGLYIKVKGKIGIGGNLKKRKFLYKWGNFSFTKKCQKLNYFKDNIKTYSGVLGLQIYITYK